MVFLISFWNAVLVTRRSRGYLAMQQEYIACTSRLLRASFHRHLGSCSQLSLALKTAWTQADLPPFFLICRLVRSALHLPVLWTGDLELEIQIASKEGALTSLFLGLMGSPTQKCLLVPARVLEVHLLVFWDGDLPFQRQHTSGSPMSACIFFSKSSMLLK